MYGEIYFHAYCIDSSGEPARLSIRKRDYSGVATEVKAGEVPFVKGLLNSGDDRIGGIYPTMATIQLLGDGSFGMSDLFTADETEYQIVHIVNGQTKWIGFLIPENFSEEDHNNYRILDLKATDGLPKLKDLKFVDSSGQNYGVSDGIFNRSFLFVISEALKKTGLSLDILTLTDRAAVSKTNQSGLILATPPGVDKIWDADFVDPQSAGQLFVGAYAQFRIVDATDQEGGGYYTSMVTEVDTSVSGTVGIRLEPDIPYANVEYEFQFFTPAPSAADVLSQATHDTRNWIDPDAKIQTDKSELPYPYYHYPDGTYDTWSVLDSIARLFDVRIMQSDGKWVVESLDKNYLTGQQYFRYDSNGAYIERYAQDAVKVLDCDDPDNVSLAGNVRFFDKTLKSVSVNYPYRYKVLGDPLHNFIFNGAFQLPIISVAPPSTFTPDYWTRDVIKNPITLLLSREDYPGGGGFDKALKISTPNEFNSFNRLRPSTPLTVVKGDKVNLSWKQSLKEYLSSGINTQCYVTMIIELVTKQNVKYYLVNHKDQPGWTDTLYMSGKPEGQWLREDGNKIWHFNSNYSTAHNPTAGGNWSPFSKVELSMADVPDDGTININFVGSARATWAYANEARDKMAWSYTQDYQITEGEVLYNAVSYDTGTWVTFYKGSYSPEVKVSEVNLSKVIDHGLGRTVSYTQDANYFDTMSIEVPLGDEINVDHLSAIQVGGVTNDLWTDRSGSLGVGTINMLLAKNVLRRYILPSFNIDGAHLVEGLNINDLIDVYNDGSCFGIKSGDVSVKKGLFNGTLEEYKINPNPENGYDGGANSYRPSGGSGSGVGAGSGSGSGGALPPSTAPQDLQSVADRGNETTLDIITRGTRNLSFLEIPTEAPLPEDMIEDRAYMWYGPGVTAGTPSVYDLPIASATVLGGVKIGANLVIDPLTGVLSALGGGSGDGSVTSVGLSAPAGFSVSGSPVTSSGVLGLSFAAGYSLPTTAKQASWDNKEDSANKVTSLSSPNNTTFPTTKAVSDALAGIPVGDFVPYTGANKAIDLNTQNLSLGGTFIKNPTTFDYDIIQEGVASSSGIRKYNNVAYNNSGYGSVSGVIKVTIPIRTSTMWNAQISIREHNASNNYQLSRRTTLKLGSFSTVNSANFVIAENPDKIAKVEFGRDAANLNTILLIHSSDNNFLYPRVVLDWVQTTYASSSATAVKENYKVEFVLTADIPTMDFVLTSEVPNSMFQRDSYYLNWNNFTSKPTTLSGYNITDAVNTTGSQTGILGNKTWSGVQTVNNNIVSTGTITASGGNSTQWNEAYAQRHTHANKAYLDTINQNMGTSDNVQFSGIKANNVLQIPSTPSTLPNSIWIGEGVTAGTPTGYELPIASATVLGGFKVGANLVIDPVTGVLSGLGSGSGSVTSVGLSAPTGFVVSNTPVTSNGTLALTFASGYSLPTTAKQASWDAAHTAIGLPLSNLTTTDKTNLISAINEVNAIEIGANNIANTGCGGNDWKSSFFYNTDENTLEDVNINGVIWKKKVATGSLRISQTNRLIEGETYTWSFDAFVESGSATLVFNNYSGGSYGTKSYVITTTPKRFYHTFVVKAGANSDLPHTTTPVGVLINNFQLQKGNKGTEWQPSIYDYVSNWAETNTKAYSFIKNKPTTLSGYGITDATPSSRTLTINGTTQNLTANRTWDVGTVTSIGLSAPTGFAVSSTPIATSGTIGLSFATGYSLPTTAKQTQWDTAYTNNHTHANKTVLDGITAGLVTNWNEAYSQRHTHPNKAYLDTVNQNLGTSDTVQFDGVRAVTSLRIPTSAPANPQPGDIWIA